MTDLPVLRLHESAALQAIIRTPPQADGTRRLRLHELADQLGTGLGHLQEILQVLEEAGLVRPVGTNRGELLVALGPAPNQPRRRLAEDQSGV